MNKKIGILILILAIVAVGGFVFKDKIVNIINNNKKLEVATDPTFPEVMGKMVAGFPEVPTYPGATLVASAKTNAEGEPDLGYRAKWETTDSVPQIMKWYEVELPKNGWKYTAPDDKKSEGEQVAKISKGDYSGYVAGEMEGDKIEIVIDLRVD